MTAALLASYGVANMVVNRYRWLSNTPRAHITNQRTMEVLRDLGPEVEAEAMMHASPEKLMGENIFALSFRLPPYRQECRSFPSRRRWSG